jgi:hypothetical protein
VARDVSTWCTHIVSLASRTIGARYAPAGPRHYKAAPPAERRLAVLRNL